MRLVRVHITQGDGNYISAMRPADFHTMSSVEDVNKAASKSSHASGYLLIFACCVNSFFSTHYLPTLFVGEPGKGNNRARAWCSLSLLHVRNYEQPLARRPC